MSAVQKSGSSSSAPRTKVLVTPSGCLTAGALGLVLAVVLQAPGWLGALWFVLWCLLGLVVGLRRESRRIDEILESELGPAPVPLRDEADLDEGERARHRPDTGSLTPPVGPAQLQ